MLLRQGEDSENESYSSIVLLGFHIVLLTNEGYIQKLVYALSHKVMEHYWSEV